MRTPVESTNCIFPNYTHTHTHTHDMADELDLSLAAGQVLSEVLHHTRTLFCPFCAASFLFEFTLKDHLKAEHRAAIASQLNGDPPAAGPAAEDVDFLSRSIQLCQHSCPFCNAAFNHLGLIPKHIGDHHGGELLHMWQQQQGNAERLQAAKQHEPSILYAACSPGLSAYFQQMMAADETRDNTAAAAVAAAPKLKSILKKTPSAGATIRPTTPQLAPGVTIRRSKSDVVKRSLSVRRELRFDPTTKRSPVSAAVAALSPRLAGTKKKSSSFKLLRNPFSFGARKRATTDGGAEAGTAVSGSSRPLMQSNQLITSTPIGLLDGDWGAGGGQARIGRSQLDNWKASVRNVAATSPRSRHRLLRRNGGDDGGGAETSPSVAALRFQCALCKRAWAHNVELLMHLREQHRGLKHWLRPQYGCATCGQTFYSNSHLIRHCHVGHGVATTTATATTASEAPVLERRHSFVR